FAASPIELPADMNLRLIRAVESRNRTRVLQVSCAVYRRGGGKYFTTPSWATVAMIWRVGSKKCPVPSRRESGAPGEDVEYNTRWLKSACRWNHTEWLADAAKMRSK